MEVDFCDPNPGLVLIIALTVFATCSTLYWIVPSLVKVHSERGTEALPEMQTIINVSRHVVNYWFIWLIPVAGGLGLLEWKYRSENKALVRTAIGVGASLVLIVIAFWVAGVTMVSSVLLFGGALPNRR